MLVAIGDLAAAQTKSTEETAKALTHLFNYANTHPDAEIKYERSDMILYVDSNAIYSSASFGRSRAAGYFFLSKNLSDPTKPPTHSPPINGPIYVLCQVMLHVLAYEAKGELGVLLFNG